MFSSKHITMKKIHIISLCSIMTIILSLSACKKDGFLTRYPVSDITEQNFFNNATDLDTYCNGFYSYVPTLPSQLLGDSYRSGDVQSDNTENFPFNKVVAGQLVLPSTASQAGWVWAYL